MMDTTLAIPAPQHGAPTGDGAPASDWQPVCRIADIPVLGARRVARPRGMDVAIFRTARDQVFAMLDRCPHKGGPLSQGIVFGTSVACPLHNWTIMLDTGCAQAPDDGCAQPFRVRIDADWVLLNRHELATLALDAAVPLAGPACRRMGA